MVWDLVRLPMDMAIGRVFARVLGNLGTGLESRTNSESFTVRPVLMGNPGLTGTHAHTRYIDMGMGMRMVGHLHLVDVCIPDGYQLLGALCLS